MRRPGRKEAAQSFAGPVDQSEVDVGEADDPVAVLGFGDADGLADEAFADEDKLAAPFDFAAGAHPADGMVGVVPGLVEALWTAPGRRPVMGRRLLAERFVRPLVVVVLAEGIEARLLLVRVGRRRPKISAFSVRASARAGRSAAADRDRCARAGCRA